MRIAIIGASFAGGACALALRKWDKDCEIVLFDKQKVVPYVSNGLNWLFRGKITELSDAQFLTSEELISHHIECHLGAAVTRIDFLKKKLDYVSETKISHLSYDYLVLATGSSPKSQVITGIESNRVVVAKVYLESLSARRILEDAQSITIIGGGPIGIEASETYARLGKKVTLVESGSSLDFKNVDADMTIELGEKMREAGIDLQLSNRVRQVIDNGEQKPLTIVSKESEWESDAVLLAINFRPQNDLYQSNLECLVDGTLAVDKFMRTSLSSVYAIGDTIQLPFMSEQNNHYMPLVSHAFRSAEVAAGHIMGKAQPILPSYKIIGHCHFGLYRGRIGLIEEELIFSDISPIIHCYENKKFGLLENHFIRIKLLIDDKTNQFLGMQCLSDYNCLELLNIMSLVMRSKMTVDEVLAQDFYYPLSHVNTVAELQQACQEMWIERSSDAN